MNLKTKMARLARVRIVAEIYSNKNDEDQRWYGMDFSPMVSIAKQNPPLLYVKSVRARRFDALAEPVLLADVDFRAAKELVIDNSHTVQACRSARMNGVIALL